MRESQDEEEDYVDTGVVIEWTTNRGKKYRLVLQQMQEIGGSTLKTGRLCLHVSNIRMQSCRATVSEL